MDVLIAVGPLAQGFIEGAGRSEFPPAEMVFLETGEQALKWLRDYWEAGSLILIKGSRGMKMERIALGLKNA